MLNGVGEFLKEDTGGDELVAAGEPLPAAIEVIDDGALEVRVTGNDEAAEDVVEVEGREFAEVRPGERAAVRGAEVLLAAERVDDSEGRRGIAVL